MPRKAQPNTPRQPRPDRRPSARARGYDRAWEALSAQVRRERPVCEECWRAASECVDHVIALRDGGDKFDRANLKALCWRCHSIKTVATEQGGRIGPRVEQATHEPPDREQR